MSRLQSGYWPQEGVSSRARVVPSERWEHFQGGERLRVGRYECDVWPVDNRASYSVLDTTTQRYVKSGRCASVAWAREVAEVFAISLVELKLT